MAEYFLEIQNDNTESEELKFFLENTTNSTIFHRPLFLSYHNESKFAELKNFKFCHLIFRDKNKIIKAFIPGAVYEEEDSRLIYKTPFYSSHGGIVYDEHFYFEDFEKIILMMIDHLREYEVKTFYFSQTSDSYCGKSKEKNNYIKYILSSKGFKISNIELLMIKKNSEDFNKNFHNTITRQINQAIKNKPEYSIENGIDQESYDLLIKSQNRLGGKPTHSIAELKKIKELFPENIYTFKTKRENKLIAGITAIKCNNNVLNTFYIYDDESERELKGMQFTYYNVFKYAYENGFECTDLGPATFGLEPHRSLISYKVKYGILPDLRTTYSLTID